MKTSETRRDFLRLLAPRTVAVPVLGWLAPTWLAALFTQSGCQKHDSPLPLAPTETVESNGGTMTVYAASTRNNHQLATSSYSGVIGSKVTSINGYESDSLVFIVNGQTIGNNEPNGSIHAGSYQLQAGDRLVWYDLSGGYSVLEIQVQ